MLSTIALPSRVPLSSNSGDTITSCPSSPPVSTTYCVMLLPSGSQIACFTCPASWPSLVRTLASCSMRMAVLPLFGDRRLSRKAGASPGLKRNEDGHKDDGRSDVRLWRALLLLRDSAEDHGDHRDDEAHHARVRDGPMLDQPGVEHVRAE